MSGLNGQHVDAAEADDAVSVDDAENALLDFRPVAECTRLTGLGNRFIVTLAQRGDVRRQRAKHGGYNYCLEDCQAYVSNTGQAAARMAAEADGAAEPKRGRSEYESELKTLVNGYKDLLTLTLATAKQAQQHERDLFTAFTGPLKVLTDSLQAQSNALAERAAAGDKARLDFLAATENMLTEQRKADTDAKRAEHLRELRMGMWNDVKRAAPHVWSQIQETMGASPEQVAAMRAAGELRKTLEKEKVAALLVFDFLSEEQKNLLCTALNYDRAELEAIAAQAGAKDDAESETAVVEGAPSAHE